MTVTEAPPAAPAETAPEVPVEPRGVVAVLGTGSHLTIGRLWLAGAAVFLLLTVVAGVLLGIERITLDELEVLGNDGAAQFFSLYRVGITFLVVLPLFLGLATAVVPLQVGTPTVAFPRAAAAAFWTWLAGSILLLVAYGIDGGPGGADPDAVALWILALGLVVAALLVGTVCVVTTIVALRTPEMTLLQVPPFSWSMVVAGVLWLLSLPPLLAGLLLAYLDLQHGQLLFGADGALIGEGGMLNWVFAQPQVYVMAIPVLGVLAEIVPVCTGTVQRVRGAVWAGIAAFGALAFGAWAQTAYDPELVEEALYIGVAFAILLPVLVVVGGMGDCAQRGTLTVRPPLVVAGLSTLLLLGAVTGGAVAVITPLDLLGTTWEVGHLNLVFTASLVSAAAALAWWSPRLFGRPVPRAASVGSALVIAAGGATLAVAEGIAGLLDQPAYSFVLFDPRDAVEPLNTVAAVGAIVLALGAAVLVLGLARVGLSRGDDGDGDDPWGGQTLEWSTGPVPVVTSATPLVVDDDGAEG
jgi:cytochrome c oxidase subunit 1